MIVPMKKVSLVVLDKDREASLEKLRAVGVVHLERRTVASDALSALMDRKLKAETASGLLRPYGSETGPSGPDLPFAEMVGRVLALGDEKKTLQEQLAWNAKEYSRVEKWGDFDPRLAAELAERGVVLVPYELSHKSYASLGADRRIIVLGKDKASVYCVAVDGEIPGESAFVLPERSLSEMAAEAGAIRGRLEAIEKELAVLASRRETLRAGLEALGGEIEFETARAGMDPAADMAPEYAVSWITGFVPRDDLDLLKRTAAENGWALIADDPVPDDNPPTLVRNNAFVRLIQPLFSFLGTTPGYREYDISLSYLLFFCLFFAMIFGDAAYGTLLLLITLGAGFGLKKKQGRMPDAVKLFILLSCCTIVWGSITGSWFAAPVEKLPGFLRALIIPPFNNTGPLAAFPPFLQKFFNLPAEVPVGELKTRWNIEFLCFTVGVIQLVLAHGKNIKKLLPSPVAVAQLGWLIMMIGLYFLVLFMILHVALPGFAVYLIAAGLGLYFIFAEQRGGNVLKNVGKSFANFLPTFLNAVSSFADIISYIRLFAVGLAGSAIANSFNSMALPAEGFSGPVLGLILKAFAAVLILIFGHSLNIVMNALSVIVHGVRLNLLEYAGNHLGMEWSGYSYNPFAVRQKKK
ncbi:MAG: V-type ATP synthase subunit I [Treponema sp.]|jgi:V/A-type H+-transporting ATPase subunit I|nr:V-type ATP synthase subunit I [Treponema sp.]